MSVVDRTSGALPGSYSPVLDRDGERGTPSQSGGNPSPRVDEDSSTPLGGLPFLQHGMEAIGIHLPDVVDTADDAGNGVHSITKKTNYWFEREVSQIEREAERLAAQWAEKGLPRHDVAREEPLEPEVVLAKRASQLLREWQLRVRTKMEDAIEEGSQALAEQVVRLRSIVKRIDTIDAELDEKEAKIERIRKEVEEDDRPVRYDRFVPGWLFWPAAIILALVEFVANFPVFRLLLPMNTELSEASRRITENVDDTSVLAGVKLFALDIGFHIEGAIVALVAVVVIVLLGKMVGQGIRPLVALRLSDYPTAAQSIEALHAQNRVLAGLSFLGVAFVLAFLYFARSDIAESTQARAIAERAARDSAQAQLAAYQAAGDMHAIGPQNKLVGERERSLRKYEDDASYALTVQRNNSAILLLNLGLVITAIVLGFGYARNDLSDRRGEHPDLIRLRDRCAELKRERLASWHEARMVTVQARAAVGRVQLLVRSNPFRGWDSKVQRLQSVIPRFRGENARLRGIDPGTIRAFAVRADIDVPEYDGSAGFQVPTGFDQLCQELQDVLQQFHGISARDGLETEDGHAAA